MTKSEKEYFVIELFIDKRLFEKEVLGVSSSKDRVEIMTILAEKLVRDVLKDELNFLYVKSLKQLKFSLILNILFKEIANEWLSYAQEELLYSREESLLEIQDKTRVAFIYSLVKEYFSQYKKYFFQEITDTFIELVNSIPSPSTSNPLIEEILNSELIKSDGTLIVQNFSQLWNRVKAAHNYKSSQIGKLQVKITEMKASVEYGELDVQTKKKSLISLSNYQREAQELSERSLDNFDEALRRLKNTMVYSMSSVNVTLN